jgi:hypothetical protein
MEPIILVAGSAVGAFTAIAMNKISKGNDSNDDVKLFADNPSVRSADLQKRIVTGAMNKVYDYERQGRITGIEREKLVAKYKQELNALDNRSYPVTLYNVKELNAFRESLVAVVDQRVAQIHAKLDDLTNRIGNNAPVIHNKPAHAEREKEERATASKPVEPAGIAEITESAEGAENDASLDEIKKQIMQTLSRLEQAEVE